MRLGREQAGEPPQRCQLCYRPVDDTTLLTNLAACSMVPGFQAAGLQSPGCSTSVYNYRRHPLFVSSRGYPISTLPHLHLP